MKKEDKEKKSKKVKAPSNTKKQKIVRSVVSIAVLAAIILVPLAILYFTGTLDKIKDVETLREFIAAGGIYSYLIFIFIQFLQVTILPLPSVVTTLAGLLVFGNPWLTIALSLIAVLLGSMFAFFLGRKFGTKIIVWIAGEEDAKKWQKMLGRGKYMFFLMMLFPGFPDDILCICAGATSMSWKFFIVTNLITRPLMLIVTCFLGSGQIIPYSGWGIPVWIVLIAVMAVCFYCSIKYSKQLEAAMEKLYDKIRGRVDKKYVQVYDVSSTQVNNTVEKKFKEQKNKAEKPDVIDVNTTVKENENTKQEPTKNIEIYKTYKK